jgi:hypothetical protein
MGRKWRKVMELTNKEIKFLTILNETRLSDGKMFGRYSDEVSKVFSFSDSELNSAVRKLIKMNMLSVVDAGGKELVYFHTDKVDKNDLDKHLMEIRH